MKWVYAAILGCIVTWGTLARGATPAFRKVVTGGDVEQDLQKAVAELGDLEALARSDVPAAGLRVVGVKDDGQAKELGIGVGDVLSAIDGKPIFQQLLKDLRTDRPQQLTFVG